MISGKTEVNSLKYAYSHITVYFLESSKIRGRLEYHCIEWKTLRT